MVSGLGFRVWGLGLRVWGLGFRGPNGLNENKNKMNNSEAGSKQMLITVLILVVTSLIKVRLSTIEGLACTILRIRAYQKMMTKNESFIKVYTP